MDPRPLCRLHVVDYTPGKKVACGWGMMWRNGELHGVKILVPRHQVPLLLGQIEDAKRVEELPVIPVWPWQLQINLGPITPWILANEGVSF